MNIGMSTRTLVEIAGLPATLILTLTVGLQTPLCAQKPKGPPKLEDPKTVLTAARKACQALRNVSYATTARRNVIVEGRVRSVVFKSRITIQRRDRAVAPHPAIRVEKRGGRLFAYNGKVATSIIPKVKRVIFDDGAGAHRYLGFTSDQFMVEELFYDISQFDEILQKRGDSLRSEAREEVHGVLCDVLSYALPDTDHVTGRRVYRYFGVGDHLPRKALATYHAKKGGGCFWYLTIKDLKVNVELAADTFTLGTPDGYEKIHRSTKARPKLLEVGTMAPDWMLKGPDGKSHELRDYRGTVVVLDFWGTWCGPCIRAMPAVQKLHESFKDRGVTVIGISCREREGADPAGLMTKNKLTYGLLLDGDEVAKNYSVSTYPTFYVIGADGRILHRHSGHNHENHATVRSILMKHVRR